MEAKKVGNASNLKVHIQRQLNRARWGSEAEMGYEYVG